MIYPVLSSVHLVFISFVLAVVSLETKPRSVGRGTLAVGNSEYTSPPSSFCAGEGWKHEWSEEFNENTLDKAWAPIVTPAALHDGSDHSAPVSGLGVTACRTARCRAENVRLESGKLVLRSERDPENPNTYYTGAVSTQGLKDWKDDVPYRMCISAKLPGSRSHGKGIWPAHWMLPDNNISEKCLDGGEVDIMEMINGDGGSYATYHWLNSPPNLTCGDFNKYHKSRNTLTHVHYWDRDFHEYAIERSRDHISYAIDGRIVHHLPASKLGVPLSPSPFFLILNTAIGGAWPGEPTPDTKMPCEHAIDYVRVSRRDPGAEPLSLLSYPIGKAAEDIDDLAHSASWADAWHPASLLEEGETRGPPPPLSMI